MKLFLSILSLLFISHSYGQYTNNYRHQVGVDLQAYVGPGISYQYSMNKLAFQVGIHPTTHMETIPFGISSTLKASFYTFKRSEFYAFWSNNFYSTTNTKLSSENLKEYEESFSYTTGLGSGFDIYLYRRLSINAQFGFGLDLNNQENILLMMGSIGMHYHF